MLYTLLLATIFSLVLSFFLEIELQNAKNLKTQKQFMVAQLMYSLTKDEQAETMIFNQGTVKKTTESYLVSLSDGASYEFQLSESEDEEPEDEKVEDEESENEETIDEELEDEQEEDLEADELELDEE